MLIVGLLSWWYGAGWWQRILAVKDRIVGLYDYFSIDLLLKTLFAPFRQISAGNVRGPLSVQLQAWLDRLISRMIGGIVRIVVVVVGVFVLVCSIAAGLIVIAVWPLIPLVPIFCVVFAMIDWIPWSI
jgi:hypothetical protein